MGSEVMDWPTDKVKQVKGPTHAFEKPRKGKGGDFCINWVTQWQMKCDANQGVILYCFTVATDTLTKTCLKTSMNGKDGKLNIEGTRGKPFASISGSITEAVHINHLTVMPELLLLLSHHAFPHWLKSYLVITRYGTYINKTESCRMHDSHLLSKILKKHRHGAIYVCPRGVKNINQCAEMVKGKAENNK